MPSVNHLEMLQLFEYNCTSTKICKISRHIQPLLTSPADASGAPARPTDALLRARDYLG